MRFAFSAKVTLFLAVGLGVLAVLAVLGYTGVSEVSRINTEMRHLLDVKRNLEMVRQDVDRAELAQLRYQITGSSADDVAFGQIALRVYGEIEFVRSKLSASDQRDRVDQLRRAVRARFDLLAEKIEKHRSSDSADARLLGKDSVAAGTEVEGLIDAIGERQWQLVRESEARVEGQIELLLWLASWGGALMIVLVIWAIYIIFRYERERRHTEAKLVSARERLSFALEGSMSAVWDWNLAQNSIYLSEGWSQILGAQSQETTVTPEALSALVHGEDAARVQAAIKAALNGTTPDYRVEHRVRRADGEWIWILSRGRVVQRDVSGRAVRVSGTNQDVSGRKAVELELEEHDRQLQLALATAGMVRWDWDTIGDVFTWPENPSRLVGPAPHGGYMGLQDMVHPEDLVRFIRTLNRTVESGEPYKDEYRITRTDGGVVWVSSSGYAERGVDGKVVRVTGVAQDVSERKRAEQALRSNEKELRLIADSVPAFIGYTDTSETLLFCNRALATFAGAQPGDLVGRKIDQIYSEEVYTTLRPYAQRALAGERVQFQRRQARHDGVLVDLDVTYIPRRGALGEVEGFYTMVTDITELKRLDRMKSEFVSTVSHELRTPLTSIRGSLGILAGGVAGPLSDKVRGFIDIAKDNCERLIRLINDILDMEKIESGKMVFQLRVLDLMELVEQTIKANEGFAAQHNVRLQLVSALPDTKVNADGDRLAQVLTNLISNACKFSPAQASVDVAVSDQGERVRVDVIDHGPGISDEFRKRIFQKFSQEDSTDVRQKSGTGLGLSISKVIVEGLGGEIGFDTEIGKGSRFYFYLPRWRMPDARAAAPARTRLLVCEDDVETGKHLQSMANDAGYESDIARSVDEVKSFLSQRRYVAMMLDVDHCQDDGMAVMREVRANPATASLPIIALCADWEQGKLRTNSEVLGVLDWLSKPIDERRLVAALGSAGSAGGRPRILHVEDDADVRNIVATIGRDVGTFDAAGSVAEARARLARERFDLVLLDLGLPDGSGWDLLPQIRQLVPPVRVIIFSAQDARRGEETLVCTFLVKSQTSEQRLMEVIREAVKAVA